MVTIKQVESKKELKQFIRFNYELYKNNPYSVPDLYEDMLNTFSEKNAAMEFCEAAYFLAYKDEKLVGRVAAIINKKANKTWNLNNVRFGWIDFVDDEEVSEALLKAFFREKRLQPVGQDRAVRVISHAFPAAHQLRSAEDPRLIRYFNLLPPAVIEAEEGDVLSIKEPFVYPARLRQSGNTARIQVIRFPHRDQQR